MSKGSKRRQESFKTVQDNWDEINWDKNVTFPVPKNKFGIFAHHTQSGEPLSDKELTAIINGPIAAMQGKLQE